MVGADHVAAAGNVLASIGFTPLGELGIPQRWAFKEPARLSGTNTYVKRQAGARAANIDEYGQAKTRVVRKILAAAGLTEAELASIAGNRMPSHDELPR